jgi:Putative peptidoglycan binding domain/N-acetylmuramoyl-L-alanine amidase
MEEFDFETFGEQPFLGELEEELPRRPGSTRGRGTTRPSLAMRPGMPRQYSRPPTRRRPRPKSRFQIRFPIGGGGFRPASDVWLDQSPTPADAAQTGACQPCVCPSCASQPDVDQPAMDQPTADQPDANQALANHTDGDQPGVDQASGGDELSEFFSPQNEFGLLSEFENWQGELNRGDQRYSRNEFEEETFGEVFELGSDSTTQPDSRIIDLTGQAVKSQRKGMRDPKKVDTLVLHQMACCFKVKDPLKRFLNHFAPHFAILPDGRILQLHPILALTWASNGFNANSVAVEFAGNFPNTRGKWWLDQKELKKLTRAQAQAYVKANQNQVTAEQIEAGRYLVRYLIGAMGLKKIVAHRQSSNMRENDPGPDIWYHVGQWAIDNLRLSDGGPGYKVGTGNPIPEVWRKWGRKSSQPELMHTGELYETEVVEVAALGVAVFQVVQSIVTSGDLSVQSDVARYVHQNTPAYVRFTRRIIEFKISAHHPRYFIDRQEFYFRLSFEYNRYDLRNVVVTVLRDKSSSLHASSFDINFRATEYSLPSDPVTSIAFNIVNGRWDPVGSGDVSFSATPFLIITADGRIEPKNIDSEENWVRFDGFTPGTLQDIPISGPTTPGLTPRPTSGSTPTLRTGSRGQAVTDLQTRLNRWLVSQGRAPLTVDGDFGVRTKAAVMAFQQAVRLTADGVVGPQTMRLLANY